MNRKNHAHDTNERVCERYTQDPGKAFPILAQPHLVGKGILFGALRFLSRLLRHVSSLPLHVDKPTLQHCTYYRVRR